MPTFVIEATGLSTKKRLVARYGENAVFQKGKPLPRMKAVRIKRKKKERAAEKNATKVVEAKPPIIRKAAAAP